MRDEPVWVIGAGLAGAELSLTLARHDIPVKLFEMKPHKRTPAQSSDALAELVCSNSLRAAGLEAAVGALKQEMRDCSGALIRHADASAVPAGGALAVDRDKFSAAVTEALLAAPQIELIRQERTALPSPEEAPELVLATGPLTSEALSEEIVRVCGQERLYFYDAVAPIVAADSVDLEVAYFASRYGKGEGKDYLNCPLNKEEYQAFVQALLDADKVEPHAFEEPRYFEGCLPIEVMAARGPETLRFGCMKPVGLDDPRTGRWPYAVVQLRVEDAERSAYNLVGFQTRMKWGAQREVLSMIPGLARAEFLRMGSIHRNTYIDSPSLLDEGLRLKARPQLRFAGQITGVEGYVESIACGFLVGLMIADERAGRVFTPPPPESTLGALYGHVLGTARAEGAAPEHVPSNIHWGLVPPLAERAPKRERKRRYGERAVESARAWAAARAD